MSDANRVLLSYVLESTWGVSPGGTLQDLRFTGESLAQQVDTIISQEIRADRQVPDLLRNGLRAGGDLNIELSYGAYDDFLSAALQAGNDGDTPAAAWSSAFAVTATDISATAPDTISSVAAAFGALNDGDWIKISGFTGDTANNGVFKIKTATAGTLTMHAQTFVNDSAGESVTVEHDGMITNKTNFNSFTIERDHQDLTDNEFALFLGMAIDTMEMTVVPDQIVTGRFGFLGKNESIATASTGSGNTAAATNDILSGIDGVQAIFENNATVNATEFSFNIANNLRERLQIGTLGPISLGSGTVDATGSFRAYFENNDALYTKFLNFTTSALAIVFQDAAGNTIVVDFPKVKYSQGGHVAEGINTDVIRDMQFTAIREPTEDVTVRIARIAA